MATMSVVKKFFGPRAPADAPPDERIRYRLPAMLLATAAVLLLISIFLPYWKMTLMAPQYPGGLSVQVYVNQMTGDVAEIDGLNHYIGMRSEEHTSELQSRENLVCRLLLENKNIALPHAQHGEDVTMHAAQGGAEEGVG